MNWMALDIGGANIKLANGNGYAASYVFPMWNQFEGLASELRKLITEAPSSDHLAVTMTGELADCFESKSAGVTHILQSVTEGSDGRHTRVYTVDGNLVSLQVAKNDPLKVAASNWHALARFGGRFCPDETALLIDIGSTSSDIVPLLNGSPAATAITDTGRLVAGELVFTGVERSPVCALVKEVPFRNQVCPVAQEVFATSSDVYLLLADLVESKTNRNTADRRPATKAAARSRMGRMICVAGDDFNHRDAVAMAQYVADAQVSHIAEAMKRVLHRMPSEPQTVVLSGHGEFLAKRVLKEMGLSPTIISLAKELGTSVSRCGSAHALAVLAREATS